jgi:HSP20 family protein|tara:strand:- start:2424 stop:2798 length:375 start_codon:yes stop_codon:yes gene_type:complete
MFFPDKNTERMMDMWVDLLSHIENDDRQMSWNRTQPKIGTVEEREDCIVLTADLPGVEKKDIELSVHAESVAFKATTEDRDYDFGQSFDFELNPNKVKATFNNGVLDVTIHKITPTKGKIIKIE